MKCGSRLEKGKTSPKKVRELVRKVSENNEGNVSKMARALGKGRATVRDAVYDFLRTNPGNVQEISVGQGLEG